MVYIQIERKAWYTELKIQLKGELKRGLKRGLTRELKNRGIEECIKTNPCQRAQFYQTKFG